MSQTREIVTLQIGHFSNFVGTHWWNIQESSFCYDPLLASSQPVNHEVLYREGQNARGEVTFTPRLVAVDLKGSLRSLPQEGTLYSAGETNISANTDKWPGQVDVKSASGEFKNEFLLDLEMQEKALSSSMPDDVQTEKQENGVLSFLPKQYDLDGQVNVWSDFLRVHFHPKSVLLLDEYHHENQDQLQFDFFGCGIQAIQKESFRELVEDRIRNLTEESDHLQGFQVLLDGHNGFAGVTSEVILHLQEEYDQKTCICYPLFQPFYKSQRPGEVRLEEANRLFTALMCLDSLFCNSSLFSPLSLGSRGLFQTGQDPVSFPHLTYKPELAYHTSAILALSLETLSLPSRLKDSPTHLKDFVHRMTYGNRKLVSSHVSVPLPLGQGELLSHLSFSALSMQAITPQSDSQNALIQSAVYCGIPQQALDQGRSQEGLAPTADEIIARHLALAHPSAALFLKGVQPACRVVAPYPNIFRPSVGGNGLIQSSPRPSSLGVQSVPVVAAHRNSSACGQNLDNLLHSAKKMNPRKFHQFLETNVELDDIKEAMHNLEGFADNYRDSGFLMEG